MKYIFVAPIKKEIIVAADLETTFKVFTEKMDAWWPRTHHIGKTPVTTFVLESGVGGRWYSLHEDDSECDIGKIMVWEPFTRLVLSWQVNGKFQYDPKLSTEVELLFIPLEHKKTQVCLQHKNLELLGEGEHIKGMDTGWEMILNLFKILAEQDDQKV